MSVGKENQTKTSDEPVGRFELIISEILRLGVTLSLATILVGPGAHVRPSPRLPSLERRPRAPDESGCRTAS